MATKILTSFLQNSGEHKGSQDQDSSQKQGDREEEDVNPFLPPVRGGCGEARGCTWKGQTVAYHDGGCLEEGLPRW